MSKPYDRPARDPGGCECLSCGVIFIGEEWHTRCAVCEERKHGSGFPSDETLARLTPEQRAGRRHMEVRDYCGFAAIGEAGE